MRVSTVFDARFKKNWIEAGTNKNILSRTRWSHMQTSRSWWVPTASSAKRLRHSIPNAQWHVQEQLEGQRWHSSRRPTYLTQRMKYPTWGQNPKIQNKSWNCKIVQREGPRVWMSKSWNGRTTTSKDCPEARKKLKYSKTQAKICFKTQGFPSFYLVKIHKMSSKIDVKNSKT